MCWLPRRAALAALMPPLRVAVLATLSRLARGEGSCAVLPPTDVYGWDRVSQWPKDVRVPQAFCACSLLGSAARAITA
jgi:hypothetical protein